MTAAGALALVWALSPQGAARAQAAAPAPGVLARFAAEGREDARVQRLAAFYVPAGEPATPFLAAGRFTAVLEGFVRVGLRDRYRFAVEGTGRFRLLVRGREVLAGAGPRAASQRVLLRKGANPLRLEYEAPARGPARLRLLWSGGDFPWEPVPPGVLEHDPAAGPGERAVLRRAGRRLYRERLCAACHGGLGEAAGACGPDLRGAGARLRPRGTEAWIRAPRRGALPARMPDLLDGAGEERDARDLAAFLFGGAGAPPRPPAPEALARRGGRLFATLGCIGCHPRPGARGPDPDGRIPLAGAGVRRSRAALAAFLRAPARSNPSTRMPSLRLSASEAEALAAFLAPEALPAEAPPAGDAARGRRLFAERGCRACHASALGPVRRPERAPPAARLAPAAAKTWHPSFGLGARERAALAAFLAGGFAARAEASALEDGADLVRARRCLACHALDGTGDLWARHEPEVEDLLPPPDPDRRVATGRPPLTWAGGKFRPDWLESFLADPAAHRVRPWLEARMPAFPDDAWALARGLLAAHGFGESLPPREPRDPKRARLGRLLAGKEKGLACFACHAVGPAPAEQVFEAEGVNFALVTARLRREFFDRWMWNPERVRPGVRMPRFADARGRTALVEILGGDARAQFDAIWHWLLAGPELRK